MKMETKNKLQDIFRNIFQDNSIEIFDNMTAKDIDDWDSLMHIYLIVEIENKFGITFTTEEAIGTRNVGEFIKLIDEKLSNGLQ
jgi:acyl carrier protein